MNHIIKKVITVFIAGACIIPLAGCSDKKDNQNTNTSYVDATEDKKIKLDKENAVEVTYNYDAFKETVLGKNELQTKEKFLNKTIKVTGEVESIESTENTITVVVTTPNKLGAMYLKFNSSYKDKLIDLKLYDKYKRTDGDIITVYGYSTGFENTCLVLENCEIE